jgi:hypothetical protein
MISVYASHSPIRCNRSSQLARSNCCSGPNISILGISLVLFSLVDSLNILIEAEHILCVGWH